VRDRSCLGSVDADLAHVIAERIHHDTHTSIATLSLTETSYANVHRHGSAVPIIGLLRSLPT
jgi:hypothetical protein